MMLYGVNPTTETVNHYFAGRTRLDESEVAALLGITAADLRRLEANGDIESDDHGQFSRTAIEAFLAKPHPGVLET